MTASVGSVASFLDASTRRPHTSGLEFANKARCEAANDLNPEGYITNLEDSVRYLPMRVPERGLESTHAIFGQLLKKDLVEHYAIFKNVHVNSQTCEGEVVVAHIEIGTKLDGHSGIVHGGILGLLVDDVLGFGFEALEIPMAVTANLNIDFRRGVPAKSKILIKCYLVERKGRKLTWSVLVLSPDEQELYCEASSVYVIPRASTKQ